MIKWPAIRFVLLCFELFSKFQIPRREKSRFFVLENEPNMISQKKKKIELGTVLKHSLSFLLQRDKKPINSWPRRRIPIIRPCKSPPYKGNIHEIKLGNSIITELKRASPNLSLGKQVTLKSPPMHHSKFHQLSKLANSSHKCLLSTSELGP